MERQEIKTPYDITDWQKVKDIVDLHIPEMGYFDNSELIKKYSKIYEPKVYTVTITYSEYIFYSDGTKNNYNICINEFKTLLRDTDAKHLYNYYQELYNIEDKKYPDIFNFNNDLDGGAKQYNEDDEISFSASKKIIQKSRSINRIRIGTEGWNRLISEYIPYYEENIKYYPDVVTLYLENLRANKYNYNFTNEKDACNDLGGYYCKEPIENIITNSRLANYIKNSMYFDQLPIDFKNDEYKYDILFYGLFYNCNLGISSEINSNDFGIYTKPWNKPLEKIGELSLEDIELINKNQGYK